MSPTLRSRSATLLTLALAFAAPPTALVLAPSWLVPDALAAGPAAMVQQEDFATPDDAVAALVAALKANNVGALHALFGPDGAKLVESGDPVADRAGREQFLALYDAAHALTARDDTHVVLTLGADAWPMPISMVKEAGRWHFDTTAGAEELINRRIGRNELKSIQTLLSAVAAEQDYFDRAKRGLGTGFYAQRFFSHEDEQDGLYWAVDEGQPPSPLGPLVDQAKDEGYPGEEARTGKQIPYHGYYFRILKGQGKNAPGGAKSYVHDGKLVGGFAIVAWPAEYEGSGVMTFLVDQDGVVFQKDLGPDTPQVASDMHLFDPDMTWARVNIQD